MLTEDNRDYIVEEMHNDLTFTFNGFTPTVNVYRYGEGFDVEFPYILIEFLPANRNKFRSISDVIGDATPSGQYKQYGFCQLELASIYCYCGEFHNTYALSGRKLTYHLAEIALNYIQRNWEQILWDMNACIDRLENLWIIKDISRYDSDKGSKIYCYAIDVYLRTQMRWNKIPVGFEEEDIIEQIGVFGKSTQEDEYKLIKQIRVS